MTNAIIIDNEQPALETLMALLRHYCPTVEISGMAATISDAKNLIVSNPPDLIFLDVELDTGSGFDLFTEFANPNFDVVFTTAHQEYALSAIKASCLDYLMKPIDFRELQQAVMKHEQKRQLSHFNDRLQTLIHNVTNRHVSKVAIPSSTGYSFFNTADIVMCRAEGNYTVIHSTHPDHFITPKTIGEIEQILSGTSFFRCHKSFLINLKHVVRYDRSKNKIMLTRDLETDLASRRQEEFLTLIRSRLSGDKRIF